MRAITVACFGALLLTSGGPAAAHVLVNSVAKIQPALDAAFAGTGPTDIRIAAGTYQISTALAVDAQLGTTVTVEGAGDGPVVLNAAAGGFIVNAGFRTLKAGGGPIVLRNLQFSGAQIAGLIQPKFGSGDGLETSGSERPSRSWGVR
jgi:hypothetical protein